MSKEEMVGGQRRSARILALEEKARLLALQKKTASETRTSASGSRNSTPASKYQKKGRKRKSLSDVLDSGSVGPNARIQSEWYTHGEDKAEHENASDKIDQCTDSLSPEWMPKKHMLEFVLDILQRKDTQEIFAQPVDAEGVVGYYDVIKEPMDFGTMRAKLQEGMYTSLQQFERDVYLISSNAMEFNAPNTVFYTEAEVIGKLAERVFHLLRHEPENFDIEESRRTRRNGKQPVVETRDMHTKVAKSTGKQPINDSSLELPVQAYHSSGSNPHQQNDQVSSGSRDWNCLNSPGNERRMTYLTQPQSSSIGNKKFALSTVSIDPKHLAFVSSEGAQYVKSLNRFVKDLGPTAKMVANKKLEKCLVHDSDCQPWTLTTSLGLTIPGVVPAPSAAQGCAPSNAVKDGQMLYDAISKSILKGKSKMIYGDEGMKAASTIQGERIFPSYHGLQEVAQRNSAGHLKFCDLLAEKNISTTKDMNVLGSPAEQLVPANSVGRVSFKDLAAEKYTCTNRDINAYGSSKEQLVLANDAGHFGFNDLLAEKNNSTNGDMNLHGSSKEQLTSNGSGMDLNLFNASSGQFYSPRNRSTSSPSGTYYPITDFENLHAAQPSQPIINQTHSSQLLNNLLNPVPFPTQTLKKPSVVQPTISLSSFKHPSGEGHSSGSNSGNMSVIASMLNNISHGNKSAQAVENVQWSPPPSWSLQAVCKLPIKQSVPVTDHQQIRSGQNGFTQQQSVAATSQGTAPLFDGMTNLRGLNSFGQQQAGASDSSNQLAWGNQPAPLLLGQNQLQQEKQQQAGASGSGNQLAWGNQPAPLLLGQNLQQEKQLQAGASCSSKQLAWGSQPTPPFFRQNQLQREMQLQAGTPGSSNQLAWGSQLLAPFFGQNQQQQEKQQQAGPSCSSNQLAWAINQHHRISSSRRTGNRITKSSSRI